MSTTVYHTTFRLFFCCTALSVINCFHFYYRIFCIHISGIVVGAVFFAISIEVDRSLSSRVLKRVVSIDSTARPAIASGIPLYLNVVVAMFFFQS